MNNYLFLKYAKELVKDAVLESSGSAESNAGTAQTGVM